MNQTYVIGEIGQNHNGSVDLAKLLVGVASRGVKEELFGIRLAPMNAIKLTKRDLNEELSASQMSNPYNSPHSFGKTSGEHRSFLELNE
jgi:sialic acid synthase SpsE